MPLRFLLLLVFASGCVHSGPVPRGLLTPADDVARAERLAKQAAQVRAVSAGIAGIAAGVGAIFLLGSQLQPTEQTAQPEASTTGVAIQQLRLVNRERDRAIGTVLVVGALGFALAAVGVSAIVDGGASEWLEEQRRLERRDLTVPEAVANQQLLEATREAQKAAPTGSGRTLTPSMKGARRRATAKVLPPVPGSQ